MGAFVGEAVKMVGSNSATIKDKESPKYKMASLFSGAGGLDLGFYMTSQFKPVFALEKLHQPVETYSLNFKIPRVEGANGRELPAVFECSAEDFDFSQLPKGITLVLAGPPCQDFSVIRGPAWDRRGIKVKRGLLYEEYVRALRIIEPAIFVFENVPGLLSANNGIAIEVILSDFKESGYEVLFADILDSSYFGVPQKRRRLFAIGVRRELVRKDSGGKIRDIISSNFRNPNSYFGKYPLTPIEVFEGNILPELGDKYRFIMREYSSIIGNQEWDIISDYCEVNKIGNLFGKSKELELAFAEHGDVLKEMGWFGAPIDQLKMEDGTADPLTETPSVFERMKKIPPNGNSDWVRGTEYEVESRSISLIYRRLHPIKPATTVVAYGGGGTWGYHYERDRSKMTHRERARLQAFPDSFVFTGSSQAIRAQIGEAVPPLLGKRIAETCLEVLEELDL